MARWFDKESALDQHFLECFLDLHLAATRREVDHWIGEPEGALALMILLDQFPRNAFRDTGHMYATDPLARHFARIAHSQRHMNAVDPELRLFFCLPFAQSEDIADQDLSVTLNTWFGSAARSHAEGHSDIIRRFGHFPHRHPLLLRPTTMAEQIFLDLGGFAG